MDATSEGEPPKTLGRPGGCFDEMFEGGIWEEIMVRMGR